MSYTPSTLDRQRLLNLVYSQFLIDRVPAGSSLPGSSQLSADWRFINGDIARLPRRDLDFLNEIQRVHDKAVARARESNWTFEAYFCNAMRNGLNTMAQRHRLQLPAVALS